MADETEKLVAQIVVGSKTIGLPVSKLLAQTLMAIVKAGHAADAPLPDEGVRLIAAFVKIPDRARRNMVVDIVQAIAVEPPPTG